MQRKTIVCLIVIPLVAMVGSAFLLTAIFGPSDNGLRCDRAGHQSVCEIRQSRFFGLVGNSSFSIPESNIRGAKALCSTSKVGGHASPSCNVYLVLDPGQDYPVLSYERRSQAEAAANKLRAYFSNRSVPAIEMKEDLFTPILTHAVAPVLFVGLLLVLRKWKSRSAGGEPAQVPPQLL